MYYKINKYCYKLSRLIKNFDDKYGIIKEIQEHLTDYVTKLIDTGLTPNQAQKKAIKDMGNVYILAYRLNKSHKAGIVPEINYYESEGLKPSITLPGYGGGWKELYDIKDKNLWLNMKTTNTERLGLSSKGIFRLCVSALAFFVIWTTMLFVFFQYKCYKSTDVFDFGKLYRVEKISTTNNDDATLYSYNCTTLTDFYLKNYKKLLLEKDYTQIDENSFLSPKGNVLTISIENNVIVISITEKS